jgi:hypothetical protein
MKTNKPKILFLDIEWRPTKALVWDAWKVNIYPDQIIEHGGLLCVGMKWAGERKVTLLSDWEHGHEEMVRQTHGILSSADAVVTYNGDRFDLPKLHGEFVLADLPPPPPLTSIDVIKTVKKLGYFMNRLGFIGPFLGLGSKMENEGINLWKKVDAGDADAQRRMAKYCKKDVTLLEALYNKVRPYVKNHPHLHNLTPYECGACGSSNTQRRGYNYSKYYKTQRVQCNDCGHWSQGTRTKIKIDGTN